ncbi:uncharacterized protein BJ171DRAFT_476151 [Polychytrium aggregatum]|uniref:uncharacterized protein n=1 Tax=Polychytrium aggregatum TaxID=110093 RepID=UPI0022FE9312|nr:uncharacterized protein BJ171DRAFT_476151 [Polychytrium aggregatum]KAI9203226.1 hypothetical protein BJ171DRAFT_476151 [Polychytrium aggregatum]
MMLSYRAPLTQIVILGMASLMTSGMHSAYFSLKFANGATGQSTTVISTGGSPFYWSAVIAAFLGGGLLNIIKPKHQVFVGGLSYSLYIALSAIIQQSPPPSPTATIVQPIASVLLGVGTGLLGSAQAALVMIYPTEDRKASYFATLWLLICLGPAMGDGMAFLLDSVNPKFTVTTSTSAAFAMITFFGSFWALSMCDPSTIIREDGTAVNPPEVGQISSELVQLGRLLKSPRLALLLLYLVTSNYFYYWQSTAINVHYFSLRTVHFNSVGFWLAQGVGAWLMAWILDSNRPRRTRAVIGLVVVLASCCVVWSGGLLYQFLAYNDVLPQAGADLFGLGSTPNAAAVSILYVLMGAVDAMFQAFAFWLVGALTNDYATLARFGGYLKSMQTLGVTLSWALGSAGQVRPSDQCIVIVVLICLSLVAAYVVILALQDTSKAADAALLEESK